jgi:hypothetical protein
MSRLTLSTTTRSFIATAALLCTTNAAADGLIDALVQRFAQSDFEFIRVQNNAPFMPIAWVSTTGYQEVQLTGQDGGLASVQYRQSSVSQGAFVPVSFGKRDVLVIGEWVGYNKFTSDAPAREFDVLSIAIPVGWARQVDPRWQLGAFAAPLGHRTDKDDWYWETLGGLFGRYTKTGKTAWIFGAYFDVSPLEDFYTPYLGATFILNEQWSLNAVVPWPSVTYAPSTQTLFRFGVAPSGTSWSVEPGERRPRMNMSAWNVGFTVERRIHEYLWIGAEIGVSGLRGLSIVGGEWEGLDTKLDRTGFALLTINFRPAMPQSR